jgi:uncharacterized LabA/DUF88 family protein
LASLCRAYLSQITNNYVSFGNVIYCTALATHRNDGAESRHKKYIRCLKDTGVEVEYGKFKARTIECYNCGNVFTTREEKETDVRIGARLIEQIATDEADVGVVVTGDTDLVAAIETARKVRDDAQIWALFPFNRVNDEIRQAVDGWIKIKASMYARHQFPNPYSPDNGNEIQKPTDW